MKSRPILFSAPMVRALLDGGKTQTRRVAPITDLNIKPHSDDLVTWGISFSKPVKGVLGSHSGGKFSDDQARRIIASMFCPYGQPGDQLWVRETFREWGGTEKRFDYRATTDVPNPDAKWHPSIFMPRAASRITLELTGVRVERLQDVSEADALAEGVDMAKPITMPFSNAIPWASVTLKPRSAQQAYGHLWESINGPGSWDKNPWVWVIEFKQVQP